MAVCILGQVGNSPDWCCCPAIGGGRRIGGLGFGGGVGVGVFVSLVARAR